MFHVPPADLNPRYQRSPAPRFRFPPAERTKRNRFQGGSPLTPQAALAVSDRRVQDPGESEFTPAKYPMVNIARNIHIHIEKDKSSNRHLVQDKQKKGKMAPFEV